MLVCDKLNGMVLFRRSLNARNLTNLLRGCCPTFYSAFYILPLCMAGPLPQQVLTAVICPAADVDVTAHVSEAVT